MPYEDYIEEITIECVEDLFDYINGRKNIPDLRDNFIFRGIKSSGYELISSALRKDDNAETIDKYICHKLVSAFDSNQDFNNNQARYFSSIIKECTVLFEFLDRADKQGFKIPIPLEFRESFNKFMFKFSSGVFPVWPMYDYFEPISLAQHYGIPTCALDWSYNYKVALYFATIGILEEKHKDKDCVLWAFNYRKFENNRSSIIKYKNNMKTWLDVNFPVVVYRPAYSDNPNLCAQEGLFTFIIQKSENFSYKPFDQLVSEELNKSCIGNNNGVKTFEKSTDIKITLRDNEKLFYKFIIPRDLKAEILNDLYKEGYTEERIFPGYDSIAKSIENKIKLDKLLDGKKSNG